MTVLVCLLILIALVFAMTGGHYFEKPEQKIVDASVSAMGKLPSFKLSANIVMSSPMVPDFPGAVVVVVGKNALDASYSFCESGIPVPLAVVKAAGKTFVSKGGGGWSATGACGNLSFSANALFGNVSSLRLVDRQPVDGVTCDHLTFTCPPSLLESLVPGAKVESKRVNAEAWVDASSGLLRHARLECVMSGGQMGTFDCRTDIGYSDFGTAPAIKAPV